MQFFIQNHLAIPRNLKRNEVQDWYFCHSAKNPPHVISRRFVISGALALPLVAVGPHLDGPIKLGPSPAEAQFVTLITAAISFLKLSLDIIKVSKEIAMELELRNKTNRSQSGNTLVAAFNERELAESMVEVGYGLAALRPGYETLPQPPRDSPLYDYFRTLEPYGKSGVFAGLPVTSPGPKVVEAITGIETRVNSIEVPE